MNKLIVTNYNAYNDRADEVNFDEDKYVSQMIRDIVDTMKQNNLSYLCAPQIDIHKRIVCMDFGKDGVKTYINPIIVKTNGQPGFNIEESSSVPNAKFAVLRNPEIHITYQEADGTVHEHPVCLLGAAAMYMQQMIDVLDGRLICDCSLPILDGWDELSAQEQDEIMRDWLTSQNSIHSNIQDSMEHDSEFSSMMKSIDFWTSVKEGKTQLYSEDSF